MCLPVRNLLEALKSSHFTEVEWTFKFRGHTEFKGPSRDLASDNSSTSQHIWRPCWHRRCPPLLRAGLWRIGQIPVDKDGRVGPEIRWIKILQHWEDPPAITHTLARNLWLIIWAVQYEKVLLNPAANGNASNDLTSLCLLYKCDFKVFFILDAETISLRPWVPPPNVWNWEISESLFYSHFKNVLSWNLKKKKKKVK